MIELLLYTTYISVDLAHHEIFLAKVGNGGIKTLKYIPGIRIYSIYCHLSIQTCLHN